LSLPPSTPLSFFVTGTTRFEISFFRPDDFFPVSLTPRREDFPEPLNDILHLPLLRPSSPTDVSVFFTENFLSGCLSSPPGGADLGQFYLVCSADRFLSLLQVPQVGHAKRCAPILPWCCAFYASLLSTLFFFTPSLRLLSLFSLVDVIPFFLSRFISCLSLFVSRLSCFVRTFEQPPSLATSSTRPCARPGLAASGFPLLVATSRRTFGLLINCPDLSFVRSS